MIQFLTFQTCLLVLLKMYYNVEFINLHFLTLFVFFGGCYIAYVKQFIIIQKIDIGQRELIFFNLPFHILPFLYIWKTNTLNKNNLLETYLYLLVYYNLFNPSKIYSITKKEKRNLSILIFVGIFAFVSL
jgi:hypothetical protein